MVKKKNFIGLADSETQPLVFSYAGRFVMNNNKRVVSIEDAGKMMGLSISKSLVERYDMVPFSEEELIVAKKWGMVLMAVPSRISLREMLDEVGKNWLLVPDSLLDLRTRVGGYMLLYPEYFGTKELCMHDQIIKIMHRPTTETPLAAELAYAYLVIARKYGRKLSRKELRCFDEPHHGSHVTVKIDLGSFRVKVDEVDDQKKSPFLALAGCYFRPLPS